MVRGGSFSRTPFDKVPALYGRYKGVFHSYRGKVTKVSLKNLISTSDRRSAATTIVNVSIRLSRRNLWSAKRNESKKVVLVEFNWCGEITKSKPAMLLKNLGSVQMLCYFLEKRSTEITMICNSHSGRLESLHDEIRYLRRALVSCDDANNP